MTGRPRTSIGTYGSVGVQRTGPGRFQAKTRFRDLDGRLREVKATGPSRSGAVGVLKERLKIRPGYGSGGVLSLSSPFGDLADLWLVELESREIAEGTKENYRDWLRVHVRPFFENYTLGEISTGRVEAFMTQQRAVSYSMAKHSRTLLNQLFGYALRHDALARNPVQGSSPLHKPKGAPQALTPDQIAAIRQAAASWRTGSRLVGPRPDGQVRDVLEVLLGTGLRPGEALGLRPVDIEDGRRGMVAHVAGTVVYRRGRGTMRQSHPKTDASVRRIPVPEFAAAVLRRRLAEMRPADAERTIFHNRSGQPLSQHNLRRTFRAFLEVAGLEDAGISPRWYRRTGATVLARGVGVDAAATHLGHASTAVTERHYIEPDTSIDFGPAKILELTLRPVEPDLALLVRRVSNDEDAVIDNLLSADVGDHSNAV